jgi:hypothetical protein
MPFPIPSREARAPCIQQDLAITHNHFALDTVLAHKGHMTGNFLVDVVITSLQLIEWVRTMARSLETSPMPPGSQSNQSDRTLHR